MVSQAGGRRLEKTRKRACGLKTKRMLGGFSRAKTHTKTFFCGLDKRGLIFRLWIMMAKISSAIYESMRKTIEYEKDDMAQARLSSPLRC
jgi:hypothetical protein